ncbi:MAG: hypothetical protein HDS11_04080 [Bacteroides sp.]|nr:hypothetical protein [Bacteroides sp.]
MLKVRQMQKNLEKYHLHYDMNMFREGSDIAELFKHLYYTKSASWDDTLFFVFDRQESRIIKPSEYRKNKPFKRFLSNLHHYGKFLEKNTEINSLSFDNPRTRIAFIRIMFRDDTDIDAKSKPYVQFAFLTPQSIVGEFLNFNFNFDYPLLNTDSDLSSEMFLYYPDSQTVKTMNYFTESGVVKKTLDELSISESLDFTDNLELLSKMSDDFMFIKEFHDEQIGYTSLTYTDILQGGKTRKEILLNKWKTLNRLDGLINLNIVWKK